MKFIVHSFDYTPRTGGVIALHRLAHNLIELGQEAYITGQGNPEWKYKLAKDLPGFSYPSGKNRHKPDYPIVVYPEVVNGNPLKAKVVRWILNTPGTYGGNGIYEPTDLIFKWTPIYEVNPNYKISGYLTAYRTYDHFKDLGLQRNHICHCIKKGRNKKLDQHPPDSFCIDGYQNDNDLINIFNRCHTFICYDENTMLAPLSVLCGCKCVIIPSKRTRIEYEALGNKYEGVAYGWDDLPRAAATTHLVRNNINQLNNIAIEQTKQFIRICEEQWI